MYTKKLIRVTRILLTAGFIMSGCSRSPAPSETTSVQTEQSETESQTSSEMTETLKSEPTGFEDYNDETIPINKLKQSDIDIEDFSYQYYSFGTYTLGRGNPKLTPALRNYLSNNAVCASDIPYFEKPTNSYGIDWILDNKFFDVDYIRYVCEENGLRFFVDEIPYELFKDRFPDLVDLCDNNKIDEIAMVYLNQFPDELGYKGSLINVDYSNANLKELSRITCFYFLRNYNTEREFVAANLPNDYGGLIENGVSVDGKYVWCLSEKQYDCFSADLHTKPKCENINILVPETREDLITSGVDVEKYDKMCEELFGGAKMSES